MHRAVTQSASLRRSHHIRLACMLALASAVSPGLATALPHYTFTKVADTLTDPDKHLDGISCVGMNNLGVVVIHANGVVWRWSGSSPLAYVADRSPGCPSINDSNEITHYVFDPQSNALQLVRDNNGSLTTIVSNTAYPYLDGSTRTYLPSLSNSGFAVYQASGVPGPGSGAGIYVGPGGTPVVENGSHPEIVNDLFASMNDNLVVAFQAFNTSTSLWGIYRGSAVPLLQDATPPIATLGLQRPVINNSGAIAFTGSDLMGNAGVFKTDDGVRLTYIGYGALQSGHDRISINSAGFVAFDGAAAAGINEVLYVGNGAAAATPVIRVGDPLDGSTALSLFMWEEALNDEGQLAFWAQLADGRCGVYRANPNKPPAATDGSVSTVSGASTSGVLTATDEDGDPLTFAIVTNGSKGTASVTNASTGAFSYAANGGASGTDTFTFKANDGYADSNVATVTVTITSPTSSCATNITPSMAITLGGLRVDRKTGHYNQTVSLKNNDGAIAGPVSLVLDTLSSNVGLLNLAGTTSCSAPLGSPYVNVDVGREDLFKSREKATVVLEFENLSGGVITYTPRVLAGTGGR